MLHLGGSRPFSQPSLHEKGSEKNILQKIIYSCYNFTFKKTSKNFKTKYNERVSEIKFKKSNFVTRYLEYNRNIHFYIEKHLIVINKRKQVFQLSIGAISHL